MSQHPSLLGSQKGKQHRSVFKRHEKLKHLIEKDKWEGDKSSIYDLPKIKSIKFKIKKEKPAATEAEAAAAAGGVAAPGQPQAAAPAAGAAKPAAAGAAKPAAEKAAGAKDKKAKA